MPLELDVTDGIAAVTINRPPVNALTSELMRDLGQVFAGFAKTRDVRVVVLKAAGDRAFCAGMDLNDSERRYAPGQSISPGRPAADFLDAGLVARECFRAVYDCAVPVVAAVDGAALGAGVALLSCCDIVIAGERASFGLPEINVGVLGGGRFLQRLVGPGLARSMYFTGQPVGATEMQRCGGVLKVVRSGDMAAAIDEIASTIAAKSPIAIRLGKQSLNRAEFVDMFSGYQIEQDYTARISRFGDAAEARNAWREKRSPQWNWS